MPSGDIQEQVMLWLSIPVNLLLMGIVMASALYVYIDAEERSKSRVFASVLALLTCFIYWPFTFVVYFAVTIWLDKKRAEYRHRRAKRQPELFH